MSDKLDRLQSAFARKSEKYWATMRTNLSLMWRSDDIDELCIEMVREELSGILDSGILTYPQTLEQVGILPEMTLHERKVALSINTGKMIRSDRERVFLEDMAIKADATRKANWSWRISQEAKEKHNEGWHPFFVTLTVDPNQTDPKQLWQDGREFRKYIRRLVNIVCKELGHKPAHKKPYVPESEYVTYAGVIEHGKSREHHHGHFLIWMRSIPSSWRVCPNKGIGNPAARTNNECLPMRTLWPWSLPGLSKALYFRSVGDIWERKYNFVLPMKNGQPMKVSIPQTAGRYITKYLAKEHKEWHHRMKATRNLGMMRLKALIKELDPKVIEALTWRAEHKTLHHSLTTMHSVPLGLIRSLAKRQQYLIKFRNRELSLTELLSQNSSIFNEMLSSVRAGARPDRMHSLDFFDWVSQFLPGQDGYSDTRLEEAHRVLRKHFPPDKSLVQHVKIGANQIGHP